MKQRVHTSYEFNLYCNLVRHFKKDKKFICIDVPNTADITFQSYGVRYMLTHGDSLGVKGGDGIIGAIPYKGNNVIVGDVGIIPNLNDPTSFYKTYGIHLHLVQFVSQYLNYNPTYASILQSVELDPRYSYDTDVHHGVLGVTLGYVKHF